MKGKGKEKLRSKLLYEPIWGVTRKINEFPIIGWADTKEIESEEEKFRNRKVENENNFPNNTSKKRNIKIEKDRKIQDYKRER